MTGAQMRWSDDPRPDRDVLIEWAASHGIVESGRPGVGPWVSEQTGTPLQTVKRWLKADGGRAAPALLRRFMDLYDAVHPAAPTP